MKTKIYLFLIPLFSIMLASCEGSRSRRMYDSFDHAIEEANNGDSSELIILIIGCIILGGLWCYNQYKKNK